MVFKTYIISYFVSLFVFLGIDAFWLTIVAQKMYTKYLGSLMKENPNLVAALIFYVLYPVGIAVFAVVPALRDQLPARALFLGGLLGLLAYSAYDLTNLATLKDWPVFITVVDIAWGTVLTGAVAIISYFILNTFIKTF